MNKREIELTVVENYYFDSGDDYFDEVLQYIIGVYSVDLKDEDVCIYGYNTNIHTHKLYEKILWVLGTEDNIVFDDYNLNKVYKTNLLNYKVGKIVEVDNNVLYQEQVVHGGMEKNLKIKNIHTPKDINNKNNKVVINYFRNFTTVERSENNSFVVEYINNENKYKIIEKDGNEYLRDKIGGDYISIGMYPIILRKKNGNIMYTELDKKLFDEIIGSINYSNINTIKDVIDNKLKWINIGDIENIISVVDVKDVTNIVSKSKIKIHSDRYTFDKDKDPNNILSDIDSKVKVILIKKSEMVTDEDTKDIINRIGEISESDMNKLIGLFYANKPVYKDVGNNKIEIIHSHTKDHKVFSKKLMGIMNILRKYNKKIDHLYNKFKSNGLGSGYYFPHINNPMLYNDKQLIILKNHFEDIIGNKINMVKCFDEFGHEPVDIVRDKNNYSDEALIEFIVNNMLRISYSRMDESETTFLIAAGIGFNFSDFFITMMGKEDIEDIYVPLYKS